MKKFLKISLLALGLLASNNSFSAGDPFPLRGTILSIVGGSDGTSRIFVADGQGGFFRARLGQWLPEDPSRVLSQMPDGSFMFVEKSSVAERNALLTELRKEKKELEQELTRQSIAKALAADHCVALAFRGACCDFQTYYEAILGDLRRGIIKP